MHISEIIGRWDGDEYIFEYNSILEEDIIRIRILIVYYFQDLRFRIPNILRYTTIWPM